MFDALPHRDEVSWTTMIAGYVNASNSSQALSLFSKMWVAPNTRMDPFILSLALKACGLKVDVKVGEMLPGYSVKSGFVNSVFMGSALLDMWFLGPPSSRGLFMRVMVCGGLSYFAEMWRDGVEHDSYTFSIALKACADLELLSTIIAGHAQGGYGEEAFELLSWMRREGPKPTEFALSSVLSVCGSMAILEQGRQLHAYALTVGLDQTALIRSALINMYSKCGSLQDAETTFSLSQNDDIVSWTAMINGYADHGYSQEAIDLFEKLTHFGLRPDPVTFIGVLSACSHVGLLDLGFHYFDSMTKEYSIAPSKEHYGCMIDLLCRAGRLGEAENMIKTMSLERNDVVWSTLLRASREHGDVERARTPAEHLLEQDPDCAGTHITLANIYASRGKWREAADVRKLMKSKGVIKEPGWSWIKIKDQVSAFVAGDKTHPLCHDLYFTLKLIASRDDLTLQELSSILYVSEE